MNLTALQPHVRASDVPPEQLAHNQALTEQEKIGEASRHLDKANGGKVATLHGDSLGQGLD